MNIDQASNLVGDEVEYRAFTGARTETGVITDITTAPCSSVSSGAHIPGGFTRGT